MSLDLPPFDVKTSKLIVRQTTHINLNDLPTIVRSYTSTTTNSIVQYHPLDLAIKYCKLYVTDDDKRTVYIS